MRLFSAGAIGAPATQPVRARGPQAPLACVVSGVAHGAHEEEAALAVARALRAQGLSVALGTPAIRGDPQPTGRWASAPLGRLAAAGSFRLPEAALCPYRLPPAADLGAAAACMHTAIDVEVIRDAQAVLCTWVDALVLMGLGGLQARLGPELRAGQLLAQLALPLLLVRAAHEPPCDAALPQGLPVAGWLGAGAPPQAADWPGVPCVGSLQGGVDAARLLQALRHSSQMPQDSARPSP
ncbi:hypothetical protein PGB34_06470 [Xenophilus arseniciresistens]|uniref:Dethiobiotin synthase n=1 Tax=Xenophilus arseniciresistens TaxID=1283306 RepID=A0AAE3N7X9_9BURK|nr:hypothetical protein [Xenophilus arseniciresistens]MDA7416006.1 hypothetical protein [Xenophilus arseniciresistens]